MKIVTWNRTLEDGTSKEVHFTRLFTETDSPVEKVELAISLEQLALRQGIISSKEEFMAVMDGIEKSHGEALLNAPTPDDFLKAAEFFATQAMIATVRYGLSGDNDISHKVAIKRLEKFVDYAAKSSAEKLFHESSQRA